MKGESTAVPGDRAWIDDLANEVALLAVVVKGEEHGLPVSRFLISRPTYMSLFVINWALRRSYGPRGLSAAATQIPPAVEARFSSERSLPRQENMSSSWPSTSEISGTSSCANPWPGAVSGGRNCHVWRSQTTRSR